MKKITFESSGSRRPLWMSSTASATPVVVEEDGMIKTITKPGTGQVAKLGDIATIKYSCYLPNDDDQTIPFARSSSSSKEKMVIGSGDMIVGWDKALRTMQVGERSIIRITDPALGYGEVGVPPFIPPNSSLEFDIELIDCQPVTANIDFDSLATADSTPVSFFFF